MKRRTYFLCMLLSASLCFVLARPVMAVGPDLNICNGTSASCIMQYVDHTTWLPALTYSIGPGPLYATIITTSWYTVVNNVPRCTVPQANGTSCVCCYSARDGTSGCYLDCPGANTGGGAPQSAAATSDPCGDGVCSATESCDVCAADCGACAANTQPCGNGTCDVAGGETCATCSTDCGACVGTVRARAKLVSSGANTCSSIASSTNYSAVDVSLLPDGTIKTTGNDGTYTTATWTNSPSGTKSFTDVPPVDRVLALACYNTTSQPALTSGYTATLNTGETLTWELGYTAGVGWFQTRGGDVYASNAIRSYIPGSAVGGRYFSTDGATGGTPGVVTYGTTYDFDSSWQLGETYVSSTNWLAKET